MTIKNVLNKIINDLKDSGISNYLFEAKVIICTVLEMDKLYLALNREEIVSEEKLKAISDIVKRRINGYPLQYLLGYQEFMSLTFKVNKYVLIPRQDTECLVETVIALAKDKKQYSILDVGTGSGCISVSLAYYINKVNVTAIDISPKALEVARENVKINKVENKVKFACENIFEYNPKVEEYDFVVSNPPYIRTNTIETLEYEVKHNEPYNALDGGENGLDFYPRLIDVSFSCLKTGGYLAFEVGHDQAGDVAQLIQNKNSFEQIKIIKDLCGRERVVIAKKINT